MTVLGKQHTRPARSERTRLVATGIVLTLAGLAAGFAIGQSRAFSGESDRPIAEALATSGVYSGPLVDRSLAMDRFYTTSPGAYSGPLVDRSLAMDRFYTTSPGA
jgi:hypothetical protein